MENERLEKSKRSEMITPSSFKGIFVLSRAKYVFITHGSADLFWKWPTRKKSRVIINLWHGIPVKAMGVEYLFQKHRNDPRAFKKAKNKYLRETGRYDYFIVSSRLERYVFSAVFNIPIEKIRIMGMPRNDLFAQKHLIDQKWFEMAKFFKKQYRYVILYAPTFRDWKVYRSAEDLLQEVPGYSLEKLEIVLNKLDAAFIVRGHINTELHDGKMKNLTTELEFNQSKWRCKDKRAHRIISLPSTMYPHVQPLLKYVDLLITDFSSVFFDYALLNRPMIALVPDEQEYERHRGFTFPLEQVFPGPIVQTFNDLVSKIEDCLKNPQEDAEKRHRVVQWFFDVNPGESSKKIWEFFVDLSRR